MKYNVTLKGKVYEVEVERGEAILVSVTDAPVAVAAASPLANPAVVAQAAAAAVAAPVPAAAAAKITGEAINAQMPGTVLQVKVNSGDSVAAGQVLVVLEAMKMEIEVKSPRAGKVDQVIAAKGMVVDTGAPLLTLA